MIIGAIGLVLILFGWARQLMSKDKKIDIYLPILYTLGSALLAIYSFQIGDLIFLVLNSLATLFGLINTVKILRKV